MTSGVTAVTRVGTGGDDRGAEQLGTDAVAEAAETTCVAIGDGCGQLDLDGDRA